MNKDELISEVAEKANCSKKDVANILASLVSTIQETVANGNKVSLIGFGTFEARKRAARKGVNPATGASIEIAAKTVPAFSAGKTFKAIVNEG